MDYKYYNKNTPTNTNADFKLLDKDSNVIFDYKNHPCFSSVTYEAIPADCTKIIFYRNKKNIPYTLEICKKWAAEMTEIGFPFTFKLDKDNENVYNFVFDLSEYKYKIHINIALQAARCLTESGINYVPAIYFDILDKHAENNNKKKLNKFIVFQDSCKKLATEQIYYNGNHIPTDSNNGKNVSKKTLFDRIKNTNIDIYSKDYCGLSDLFRGGGAEEE